MYIYRLTSMLVCVLLCECLFQGLSGWVLRVLGNLSFEGSSDSVSGVSESLASGFNFSFYLLHLLLELRNDFGEVGIDVYSLSNRVVSSSYGS